MAKNKKKNSKGAASKTNNKSRCFVIMPFGEWFDDYYDNVYKPAIEDAGLFSCRADDLYRPSTIIHDIWDLTRQSKLLMADLTGKNPNVFYELGLAHALGKPVIMVAESIDDVPFDLRALRIITYDKNQSNWGAALKNKIVQSIKEVLESPLKAVLPTFLNVKEAAPKAGVTPAEKELISLRQDMDYLKRELERRSDQSSRYTPSESISVHEIRARIQEYMRMNMSDSSIITRLIGRYGFSVRFAKTCIAMARRQNELSQNPKVLYDQSQHDAGPKAS